MGYELSLKELEELTRGIKLGKEEHVRGYVIVCYSEPSEYEEPLVATKEAPSPKLKFVYWKTRIDFAIDDGKLKYELRTFKDSKKVHEGAGHITGDDVRNIMNKIHKAVKDKTLELVIDDILWSIIFVVEKNVNTAIVGDICEYEIEVKGYRKLKLKPYIEEEE